MDYQILKNRHKVGHPIKGTVKGYEEPISYNGTLMGTKVLLATDSDLEVKLPFDYLFDEIKEFDPTLLPSKGKQIDTVVKNCVDGTLYVSARPGDLKKESILEYQHFYERVGKTKEGQHVNGIVKKAVPFGLFVDIGYPFLGLIDIGHSDFNKGKKLPTDYSQWPKENDTILCIISYYRFYEKQFGLDWID